ncbi:hypothetical protein [Nocardia crassostreae]|uniref:hypothetical protein n=1 Tax=Nocardia crassostreae TaxID=53428 RepID=UPI000AC583E1|nr:hypothetical protein [Nocardia crassostreae]
MAGLRPPVPARPALLLRAVHARAVLCGAAARRRGAATGTSKIRRTHRWSAIVFIVTVLVTFVALSLPEPIVWVSYLPLLPLAALLGTGLYMFVRWARKSQVTA